jgi:hypothetical protein
MSIVEDHGTYWDNDEGFLVPLLRHLDVPRGDPDTSRFYRDSTDRVVRIERRRQRVAVLALWRWVATLAGLLPIFVTTIAWVVTGGAVKGPAALGAAIADWFGTLPGHQLISGPLDFLAGGGDYPDWIASFGDWLIGVLVVGLVFWAIAIVGGRLWASWDQRERAMARLERLVPIHRRDVAVVSALLVVLTVALSADAFKLLWG